MPKRDLLSSLGAFLSAGLLGLLVLDSGRLGVLLLLEPLPNAPVPPPGRLGCPEELPEPNPPEDDPEPLPEPPAGRFGCPEELLELNAPEDDPEPPDPNGLLDDPLPELPGGRFCGGVLLDDPPPDGGKREGVLLEELPELNAPELPLLLDDPAPDAGIRGGVLLEELPEPNTLELPVLPPLLGAPEPLP